MNPKTSVLSAVIACGLAAVPARPETPFDPVRGLVLRGTVVTMDDEHRVLENASVLVRNDQILAIWPGRKAPKGTPVGDAVTIELGPSALIFPGLINLHNHPTFDMLPLWPAPSSHTQPAAGRPLGTEPYANRYQWNRMFGAASPEFRRLVDSPQFALSPQGLDRQAETIKYAEVEALLGGGTALQGAPTLAATDGLLVRNVEGTNFGRARIQSFVSPIASLAGADLDLVRGRMESGATDAWLVHLAEGVGDADRRPGDPVSSRAEFATLKGKGLLADTTVVIHGLALEAADFAEMRAAPSARLDGTGDGLGAKLVWSPLSNFLLYGHTAQVYDALAADVLVSLGTDWTPSGSRNLLGELKVADVTLRASSLLGSKRALVPELSVDGKHGHEAREAERALDRLLVDMVTRNPAKAVRWYDKVGSIEAGKTADLLVLTPPRRARRHGLPSSPYRELIDATERDVRLVLVGGEPLAGDASLMKRLKDGDYETVASACRCYEKGVDVTKDGVPKGDQTLAVIQQTLGDALNALGGDHPPAGGGPADDTNTYSYLKQHVPLPFPMTDAQFRQFVLVPVAGTVGGKLNLERLTLPPLLTDDDDFFFDVLGARIDPVTSTIDDPTPPFLLYPSNANHVIDGFNPFDADRFEERWYGLGGHPGSEDDDDDGQIPWCCDAFAAGSCARNR
jgi:5-methylthioadenosine/S-adenosylhomocysteine deaminase